MEPDFSVAVIEATVMIEQQVGGNRKAIGTGFLVTDTAPDGHVRVVLVTAKHVFEEMPRASLEVGFRAEINQEWAYTPADVNIRNSEGRPLWTSHPERDVAVIELRVPAELAAKAIPLAYLADDDSFAQDAVAPGEEFMALGYPRGLSSNAAGFPILRMGRLASYPIGASAVSPTFLLDFSVFPGNSGGPVLRAPDSRDGRARHGLIAGLLTQQVEVDRERMDIGIVTHARFVRETLGVLDGRQPVLRRGVQSAHYPSATTAIAIENVVP
ncbi:trypsin-like serine peptidase [Brevundimonas variabilis]|uniref:S1-C subfamily serine protease n=1 Tax=Brevundimonas variabilis TaxID=74312 RepID=A0A7W9CJ03_9CAUL|nr:serine protease [Brevundimonas variabilis]MBB5746361.1 S1-C subfamily serine protease [Brevundimonas variabilis]